MGTEVNLVVDNICEKLGTTVEFLIPELARACIAQSLSVFIVSLVIVYLSCKGILGMPKEEDFNDRALLVCILCIIGLALGCLFLLITGVELIGWFASPTAQAVLKISNILT